MTSILQFLQVVILARILMPEAVGVVALLAITVSLIDLITDMGMANALIQKKRISDTDVSSVYWMNVLIGAIFAVAVFFLAEPLAHFYGTPTLVVPMKVLALVFLVTPHGMLFRGLLERETRFRAVGVAEGMSGAVMIASTVVAALCGLGALSYAIGRVASALVRTFTLRVFARNLPYRIRLRLRLRESWGLIRFGAVQTLDGIVSFAHNSVGALVVGRFVSVGQLGGFNLAFNLAVTVPGTVNSVFVRSTFPSMSRIQDDRSRMVSAYLRLLGVTAIVNFPVLVGLAIVAPEAVPLVFGAQWAWTVPLVQLLAIGGCIRALTSPIGSLFLAAGRPSVPLAINVARTIVVLAGSIVGVMMMGPEGAAVALAVGAVVTLALNYIVLKKHFHLGVVPFLRVAFTPLVYVLPMAIVAFATRVLVGSWGAPDLVTLLLSVFLGAVTFALTLVAVKEPMMMSAVGRLTKR